MTKFFEETGKKYYKLTNCIHNDVLDEWSLGLWKTVAKVLDILSKIESDRGGSSVRPKETTSSIVFGPGRKQRSKEINNTLDLLDRITSALLDEKYKYFQHKSETYRSLLTKIVDESSSEQDLICSFNLKQAVERTLHTYSIFRS